MMGATHFSSASFLLGLAVILTTFFHGCVLYWIYRRKDIPNKDLVKRAYQLFKDKKNIKFKHIMAHTGLNDRHSLGNAGADRLANESIGVTECPYKEKKDSN